MAKNTQLSGWSILRAVIPPWQDLDDPLVQYDIRHSRRVGRRPWMAIILGYLTLIALNIYFAGQLFADDPIDYQNLLEPVLTIGVTGLVVSIIYGHWRLLLAVSAKATAIIAARRRSGDWDLIAITPVEKSRWLRAQIISLGWQVFPIVRTLIIVQTILVVVGFSYMIYTQYEQRRDEQDYLQGCQIQNNCYPYELENRHLSVPVYALSILPYGVLLIAEPFITTGVFAAVSLFASSRSQQSTMSLLYSFLGIYVTRVILSMVFLYGFILFGMLVSTIMSGMGLVDESMGLDFFAEGGVFFLFYCCIGSLVAAFFLEWYPAFAPALLLIDTERAEILMMYIILLLTYGLAYVLAPLLVMQILGGWTVDRLNQRER